MFRVRNLVRSAFIGNKPILLLRNLVNTTPMFTYLEHRLYMYRIEGGRIFEGNVALLPRQLNTRLSKTRYCQLDASGPRPEICGPAAKPARLTDRISLRGPSHTLV